MDVYLFEYDMPVIKYCPKNANLSSSNVNILLNNVIKVEHVSKFSKPNVLAIDFPLFSLLLSFKTRERMDKWMSQLLCLTGNEINVSHMGLLQLLVLRMYMLPIVSWILVVSN